MEEKKILVVDDDEKLLKLIGFLFEPQPVSLETATNGEKGLALAKETLPDLIMTDLMMPVMDGHEFCKTLKETEGLKDIPVVALSASIDPSEEERILSAGACRFIRKPFQSRALVADVMALMSSWHAEVEVEEVALQY